MDFEVFILLVLLSSHLLSFWIGWVLRDSQQRRSSHSAN